MVSNARVGKSNELVGSFSGELGRSKEVDEKCCQLIRDNLRWASALNYPHGVPPRPCLFGDIHKLNIPDLYCPGTSYNQKKEKFQHAACTTPRVWNTLGLSAARKL